MGISTRVWRVAAAFSLASSLAVMGAASSAAAQPAAAAAFSCSGGTAESPATIPAGVYSSLTITSTGTCFVDDGPVTVTGDTTVAPGGFLGAVFSFAPFTVDGNFTIGNGAAAFLGCEPDFFPCFDDGTMTMSPRINGNLTANSALTAVTHAMNVGGNIKFGGGGGVACPNTFPGSGTIPGNTPAVNFMNSNKIPPYFDNENNTVGGNILITGIQTCWIGSLRNTVAGNFVDVNNTMADPDAGEVLANHVAGNLICVNNEPATQFGDSGSTPNVVGRTAVGQCGFNVMQPNPAPDGPLEPISIRA